MIVDKKKPLSEKLAEDEKLYEKLKKESEILSKNFSEQIIAVARKFVEEFTAKNGIGVDTESLFKNPFAQALTVSQ